VARRAGIEGGKDVSERSSAVRRVLVGAVGAAGVALAAAGCSAGQLAQTSTERASIDGASAQIGPIALRDIVVAYPDGGKYAQGASARLEFVAVNDGSQADTITEIRSNVADRVEIAESGAPTPSETPSGSETASGSGSETAGAPGLPGTSPATGTSTSPSDSSAPNSTPAGSSAAGSAPATTPSATDITPIPSPAEPVQIELPPGAAVPFTADNGPAAVLLGLTKPLLPSQRVQITFVLKKAGAVTVTVTVAGSGTPVPGTTINIQPTESG
jgi:copper(I)-binding protein